MIKSSILKQLSHAQKSHFLWIEKANNLISGSLNNQNPIPFDSTECGLGVWITQEGRELRKIKSLNRLISEIEIHHNRLHNIYLNIYQIFFMIPKQKSFLEKLFNFNSNTENEEVKEAVKLHFEDIEQSSNRLIELLIELEERIKRVQLKERVEREDKILKKAI